MMKFEETSISQTLSVLECGKNRNVDPAEVHFLVKTYFAGISDFLCLVKTPNSPCSVVVQDLKGNFIVGAVVSHNEAEEEDEALAGNWNYVWTFNKDDIPEGTTEYQITNTEVVKTISKRGFDLCRLTFTEPGFCGELAVDLFNTIHQFLEQNAPSVEGEKFEVELDSYFHTSVSKENGEMVFEITPAGEMKAIVKKGAENDK